MTAIRPGRLVVFVLVAATGFAIDLTTKNWIFNRLGMPNARNTEWLVGNYFGLQTSVNEGALFGMGQGYAWIFAALSGVALLGIVAWLLVGGVSHSWLLTIALGAVTGGILGNLHDRLGLWRAPGDPDTRHYAVRDWILFQYDGWVWPNFNVADSLLVCGIALWAFHTLRYPPPVEAPQTSTTKQASKT